MRDRRPIDDLSLEELEQALRLKRQQARRERLERFARQGRRPDGAPLPEETEATSYPPVSRPVEVPHESFVAETAPTPHRQRSLRDKILLGVEIGAAVGLVAILISAGLTLRDINEEAASAQAEELAGLPTPTATPIITAVVLPGGHTPPTSPGGAQPNYDEVPENLRPLVEQQFFGVIVLPTPGPSQARRIRIPAIGIDAPVVQGDGWEQLKQGVGQHVGTGNPGQPGNVVLSAHNDIYGELFRFLDRLAPGDQVILETLTDVYVYEVVYTDVIPPTEVSVMGPTYESIVTLISCYPYLVNTDRIVVIAQLVED